MDSWEPGGSYFRQVPRDKPGPCGLYKASITYSLEERCFRLQTALLVVGLCWEEDGRTGIYPLGMTFCPVLTSRKAVLWPT